jgi:hypothetical protein
VLAAANFWYVWLAPHVAASAHHTVIWGFVHGFLVIPNFVDCLFNNHITIYQSPNSGAGYNFGFVLGAAVFFGSIGSRI